MLLGVSRHDITVHSDVMYIVMDATGLGSRRRCSFRAAVSDIEGETCLFLQESADFLQIPRLYQDVGLVN